MTHTDTVLPSSVPVSAQSTQSMTRIDARNIDNQNHQPTQVRSRRSVKKPVTYKETPLKQKIRRGFNFFQFAATEQNNIKSDEENVRVHTEDQNIDSDYYNSDDNDDDDNNH